MNGNDIACLKADAQAVENYMAEAIERAPTDATRAFAAIDDARKRMQQMHAKLHYEHIKTIRRT